MPVTLTPFFPSTGTLSGPAQLETEHGRLEGHKDLNNPSAKSQHPGAKPGPVTT